MSRQPCNGRWPAASRSSLWATSSKRGIGRAAQTDRTLDVSAISGVTLYEPEELVLSARAGTPLAEIEKLLADKNQELAFEPPDLGSLLGGAAGAATLGGTLAVNLSGPRRIKAGAARDFALGVRAVSGRGEIFKAGGRVVKNVTGYDLPKLLAGSWGTLAVMTELTIKVLPRAEDVATVLVLGLTDARAAEAMAAGMGSSNDVSGAAHLPPKVAAKMPVAAVAKAGRAVTALRLEGIAPSIAYRRQKLEEILQPIGTLGALDAEDSRRVLARGARRDAVRSQERARGVAHFGDRDSGCRDRHQARGGNRRRAFLRLGRRAVVGRDARRRAARRHRARDPWCPGPRDAHSC